MDENLELAEYVYKNSEMGAYTLNVLLKDLDGMENKIKKTVEDELKGYEKLQKQAEKLIDKNKLELKTNGVMAKLSSSMGIKMETMKDNSDASIAHMLTQGITMGLVDIESKINNYKSSCKPEFLDLAKDFKKFSENEIENLKKYM